MLNHPHILPIYDVGLEDGIAYFVIEYAPHGSLRDRLQQEALQAYERSIQLDANSAVAYSGKGDALYYLKRYQDALLAYERAIELHPNFAAAQNGKSWTLWQLSL